MAKSNRPGVRCVNCGCTLDYGERCDCEQRQTETVNKQTSRRRQLVERNRRLLERAYADYDCC